MVYLWQLCVSKKLAIQEVNNLQVEVVVILIAVWSAICEWWAVNRRSSYSKFIHHLLERDELGRQAPFSLNSTV